jgi:hypothetical protein
MGARIALGIVAVMRAALIYGDGAELATRPLKWPTPRIPRPRWQTRSARMSRPFGVALGGKGERR